MGKRKVSRTFKKELTEEQRDAVTTIWNNRVIALSGVAGTSKTFVAARAALDMFYKESLDKITLIRPMVATEDIGILPGNLEDKMVMWMIPIIENMYSLLSKEEIDGMMKKNEIRFLPLQFCQGVTYTNEVVIVDEAQNATKEQLEMILTRIGVDSTVILTGDPGQIQMKRKNMSGFQRLLDLDGKVTEFAHVELTNNYRDPIVREIIENYK